MLPLNILFCNRFMFTLPHALLAASVVTVTMYCQGNKTIYGMFKRGISFSSEQMHLMLAITSSHYCRCQYYDS